MTSPLKRYKPPHADGVFGAVRKYDIHTGIDLYCESKREYDLKNILIYTKNQIE